jgi:hypothetical protein
MRPVPTVLIRVDSMSLGSSLRLNFVRLSAECC